MIDIGANLTNRSFRSDLDEVLGRARTAGLEHIVVTGSDVQSSQQAIELCSQYPNYLSSTVGIHPHHAGSVEPGWMNEITTLSDNPCVVAIGETGLDFYRNFSEREDQIEVFRAHLGLAERLNLPLFIHDRDSDGELLRQVSQFESIRGVIHCFTGSQELLLSYLDRGLYIGVTGWVCDRNRGKSLRAAVHFIPDDRLLVETDAPYLSPHNAPRKSKKWRNEPDNLPYVVEVLAEARSQSVEHIRQITQQNAKTLFALN